MGGSAKFSYSNGFSQPNSRHNSGRLRTIFGAVSFVLLAAVALTIGQIGGWDKAPSWSSLLGCGKETHIADGTMEVHVIDVGQGDCVLVRSGEANILIDAGENGMGEQVAAYLIREGVVSLDLVVCSHPHTDHIGGMDYIINCIDVGAVLMPNLPQSMIPVTQTYSELIGAIERKGLTPAYAQAGDSYTYGDMTMNVLFAGTGSEEDGYNDYSIALRFVCGEMSFFTAGDIEQADEEILLQSGCELHSRIYKSSHHGSGNSNSESLLDAVAPEYAFVCCGENNDYGHPHDALLERYRQRGIQWQRTDLNGSIVYSWDGSDLTLRTER